MITLRDFGLMPEGQRGRALHCVKSVPEHFVLFGGISALLEEVSGAAELEGCPFVHQPVGLATKPRASTSGGQDGFYLVEVDLSTCKTDKQLLKEIGRTLRFPSYYGGNWAALFDCMQDCLWLPPGTWVFTFTGMSELRTRLPKAQSILMDGLFDINNPTSFGEDIDLTPKTHRKRFVFSFNAEEEISLKHDESYQWSDEALPSECIGPSH